MPVAAQQGPAADKAAASKVAAPNTAEFDKQLAQVQRECLPNFRHTINCNWVVGKKPILVWLFLI